MKKLMIAAAIVCAAAMSYAASVTWNVAVGESDSDWNPAVGNIILATAGADPWTFTFNADGSALGSITGDNGTGGIFAQKTAWTVTMTAQLLNEDTTPAGQFTKTIDILIPYLDESDPTQVEKAFSGLNDQIADAFRDSDTGALPTAEAAAGLGWSAVPEPTSGLLLLIGVAGLALRRRRA